MTGPPAGQGARSADEWAHVAAPGTDPLLLEDLVVAMGADDVGIRRRFASAVAAGTAPDRALREVVGSRRLDAGRGMAACRSWSALGARLSLPGDPGFPERLVEQPAPPPLLAWRGSTAAIPDGPTVALVGSRAATPYGRGVAAWLAEAAAEAGVRVVSGGAVGIDAAAHAAALAMPGGTSVVLGCGLAVGYPRTHARTDGLFDRILGASGTIMSEWLPDAPPIPARVRSRNRLVAGLADVVVVVEGSARSGALVTASEASDRGVTVMAVPGDVRAPGSAAPHHLLVEGAAPCTEPADLLDLLGVTLGQRRPVGTGSAQPGTDGLTSAPPSVLPPQVRAILVEAWPRAVAVDDLARRVGLEPGPLLAALTRARVAGEVAQAPAGITLRRDPRGRAARAR